jgi:hypothetical protein
LQDKVGGRKSKKFARNKLQNKATKQSGRKKLAKIYGFSLHKFRCRNERLVAEKSQTSKKKKTFY